MWLIRPSSPAAQVRRKFAGSSPEVRRKRTLRENCMMKEQSARPPVSIPVWRDGDRSNERGRLLKPTTAHLNSQLKPLTDGDVLRPYIPDHPIPTWPSFLLLFLRR